MEAQTLDPHPYADIARDIRARVVTILGGRGLLPRFSSWRLAQDPTTGLVVLFGVLNAHYIATHSQTATSAYFQPHLLEDLTRALEVQVVPSDSDGLRYAFILDRGRIDEDPTGRLSQHFPAEQLLILDSIARPASSPNIQGQVP
ncbi:MAG: hypothetical protein JNL73_05455 [Anaerolineales bacterium]|nr:hypothetical protein [Anaerolineales bacterium]